MWSASMREECLVLSVKHRNFSSVWTILLMCTRNLLTFAHGVEKLNLTHSCKQSREIKFDCSSNAT